MVAAGAFILPSFLLMLGLTFLYLRYGQMPQLAGAMKGVGAAVVAIIIAAAYRMSKPALKDRRGIVFLIGAMLGLVVFQANVVLIVILAGLGGLLMYGRGVPAAGEGKGPSGKAV